MQTYSKGIYFRKKVTPATPALRMYARAVSDRMLATKNKPRQDPPINVEKSARFPFVELYMNQILDQYYTTLSALSLVVEKKTCLR